MTKILGIAVVALLLVFAGYKILSGRVDSGNPDEVGAAFLKALKIENVSRAKKYYLPAEADAWETAANLAIYQMKSNATASFKGAIPDEPVFKPAPTPKGAPAGDKWMIAGETTLAMRQVDGKWYVAKSSQP
jgi:hypothetical protein